MVSHWSLMRLLHFLTCCCPSAILCQRCSIWRTLTLLEMYIYSTNQRTAVNKNLCHKDEDVERLRKYLTVSAWESARAGLSTRKKAASQSAQAGQWQGKKQTALTDPNIFVMFRVCARIDQEIATNVVITFFIIQMWQPSCSCHALLKICSNSSASGEKMIICLLCCW